MSPVIPFSQEASSVQLLDKSIADDSLKPPLIITLEVAVTGTSGADLDGKLDSIRKALNEYGDRELALDYLSDRYWMARFNRFTGDYLSPDVFKGTLEFICYDPLGYGNSDISHEYTIDENPEGIVEDTGGTGIIRPVYTLTAGAILTGVTIILVNTNTKEQIEWTGSMAEGEELVIDTDRWIVELEGVASMGTVEGQFPTLVPDTSNLILVSEFSGTLTITYKNRYT